MEYILKDTKCRCGGDIVVTSYEGYVNNGMCSCCFKGMCLPGEKYEEFVKEHCIPMTKNRKVLECSSKGDKRFSALYAKVSVNGVFDSIENHYQKSKVFKDENGKLIQYDNWKMAKGKMPIAFNISGYYLPLRFGSMFYSLMWYKYLKANPSLENVLEQFDIYNDIFKSKNSYVCQADVIRAYMEDKNGIRYNKTNRGINLYNSCKELLDVLTKQNTVIIENGNALTGYPHIVAHQVNSQGVMGSGIAKSIKETFYKAYTEYVAHPLMKNEKILGECQIVDCESKIVANVFGQFFYGRNPNTVYTNYTALRKGLTTLKEYAKANKLIVSMPYEIGCGYAHGDWNNIVYPMIKEIFSDYYVILYKLK